MPSVVEVLRSRLWPRAATLALITIGLAACSSVSSQLNDSGPPVGQVDGQAPPPQNASPAVARTQTRPGGCNEPGRQFGSARRSPG